METCPVCGTSLTEEMLETGYCYGCGEELLTHKELHSAVLEAQKSQSIRLHEAQKSQSIRFREAAAAKKTWEDTIKRSNNSQYYEYRVMTVLDTKRGNTNIAELSHKLNEFGRDGWRLVTSFTNELGKDASGLAIGGAAFGVNSTTDEVILIFEKAYTLSD